ncbi:caspase family protein [Microbispora sp. NPDC046933]|uniref:caspase, EACC1-associated type n=1 Tax=Microbispora sp. NPDC046933 TaxID=3155618 RepID=UPI0033DDF83C
MERAGLDPGALTTVLDPAGPVEFGNALVEAAAQATSTLMVYYLGHGLLDADNELHLATYATVDLTKGIAEHQALPYSTLRKTLVRCAAPVIVVVIDCCFSGRAATPATGDTGKRLLDATPQGTFLLAATTRDALAWAPTGQRHTAFTGALIDLLTAGDPTAPRALTLDDVYRCLARTLHERGFPAPRRQATDHGDWQPIALNPAHPVPATTGTAAGTADSEAAAERQGEFSPYRGLAAYGPEDAEYFFGRTELTGVLVDRVAAQVTAGGPLVVTGPSGSGKSSVLRAGLIPALRRSSRTEVALMTPGADPVGTLVARFAHLTDANPADLRERVEREPAALDGVVREALGDRQAVILVDQFEEVFTACPDERQQRIFVRALHGLCRGPADAADTLAEEPAEEAPAAVVVIGVRADFFGHCTAHPELVPALEHAVVVGPMTPPQLSQAIEGPARRAGFVFEPGLIELILDDIGSSEPTTAGAAVLPLLSHALLVTWQHREGRTLTMAGYRAKGGIHGALARTADDALEQLDLPARQVARRMLTRLVRVGEGQDDTRRTLPLADLLPPARSPRYATAREILDHFVRARLLTVDVDVVQIAHEALIRSWPQLRRWIEADRATLLIHQQLSEDAAEWRRHDRDPAYLYQSTRLAAARQASQVWRADPGRYPPLPDVAWRFLEASRSAEDRRTRRGRRTMVALAALLALALVGAGTAGVLAARAAKESADSLSRQLAAQSESVGDSDITLSRQLSTAAWHISHTQEARLSMLKALLSPQRAMLTEDYSSVANTTVGRVTAMRFLPGGSRLVTQMHERIEVWDAVTGRENRLPGVDRASAILYDSKGFRLVTQGEDRAMRLLDGKTGKTISTLDGLTAPDAVMVSSDSSRFASKEDNTIRVWDGKTGEALATVKSKSLREFGLNPDGSRVATSDGESASRLWDAASGKEIATLGRFEDTFIFSPDGSRLATVGVRGVALLRDGRTGKLVATLGSSGGRETPIGFTFDSSRLITAGSDNSIRLWDGKTGKGVAVLNGHKGPVNWITSSPDSSRLATAGSDNSIRLWDGKTGKGVAVLNGHKGPVNAVAFTSDGSRLASGSSDNTVRVWDVGTASAIAVLRGHIGPVTEVAFSPDGSLLATSGADGTGRLWNVAVGEAATLAQRASVTAVAFTSDGSRLAALSDRTWMWDLARGSVIGSVGDIEANAIAFNQTSSRLVSVGRQGEARLWDVNARRVNGTLDLGQSVSKIAINSGSRLAFVPGAGDPAVRLWDVAGSREIAALGHEYEETLALAFSSDGSRLATAGTYGIRLWDGNTGKSIASFDGDDASGVNAVVFSPDGTLLATVAKYTTVRVWDVATGEVVAVLNGHTGHVNAVAFSPDGARLATAGDDTTVRVWDVATGEVVAVFTGHTGPVKAVAFSPDGARLATAGEDTTIRVWNMDLPSDPFSAVCALTDTPMSEADWARYLGDTPYRKVCP